MTIRQKFLTRAGHFFGTPCIYALKSLLPYLQLLHSVHIFQNIALRRGMTDLASKRIQKELAAMVKDPPPGCTLLQMGDDIFRLDHRPFKSCHCLAMSVFYCVCKYCMRLTIVFVALWALFIRACCLLRWRLSRFPLHTWR